ncbi:acetyltransferase [Endozoicomonas gorgoniicola]|uniref:Acetyltransferase n=1 Tax=Endozoicomonas gorgoniicola TaxID=1234144 RepID=A0ABT3MUV2_9GAMM|nr:acetyltransferase [Endozoicomonas gorgoniicola]MCW7553166.1 acetyltransferase [Endozoicomonas gorgoniicola]
MIDSLFGVYGASGFGREVMPLAANYLNKQGINQENLYFIDDSVEEKEINGYKVIKYSEFKEKKANKKFISLAIANNKIRNELANALQEDGIISWSLHHDNVVKLAEVSIKEGYVLCPFVCLTSNIKIGKHFHANIYSYVGHDCTIGDFVTFAPGVKCNGNIIIEDNVYIGTGAIIKQGKPNRPLIIGKGAVVGMGAVVTKNVPEGDTVIGNPAKTLSRKSLRG